MTMNYPASKPGIDVARLLFLLQNNRLEIPKDLVKYVPGGDWIQEVLSNGPSASPVNTNFIEALMEQGGSLGRGSIREAIGLMKKIVDQSIMQSDSLGVNERIKIYRKLEQLNHSSGLVTEEVDLNNPSGEEIQKWDSGFSPIDRVFGGMYQAIIMVMAPPGLGKTSIMLSMMESLRAADYDGSLWYIENEIPRLMMEGRMNPIFGRTKFDERDRLICGPWSARSILEEVMDNPDPNRIIFFDSPDVISAPGEGKRFYLEAEYQTLIEVKRRSALVVVSSWPNRSARRVEHQYATSEAVAKSWYSDMILGINPGYDSETLTVDQKGFATLSLMNLKNRFGKSTGEVTFRYNYATLEFDSSSVQDEDLYWDQTNAVVLGEPVVPELPVANINNDTEITQEPAPKAETSDDSWGW